MLAPFGCETFEITTMRECNHFPNIYADRLRSRRRLSQIKRATLAMVHAQIKLLKKWEY